MIRENQRLLNWLNVFSDGVIVFLSLPAAFWIRFFVLPGGIISVPLSRYMAMDIFLTGAQLFIYGAMELYRSYRTIPLRRELPRLWCANGLMMLVLLSGLFVQHDEHYSRGTLAIFFLLSAGVLSCKRVLLRKILHYFRQEGYNLKHVLILGSGSAAQNYLRTIRTSKELGFHPIGHIASQRMKGRA